jgi:hypothetical protein
MPTVGRGLRHRPPASRQSGDRDHRSAPLALVLTSCASFLYTGGRRPPIPFEVASPDRGVEHEGFSGRRAREDRAAAPAAGER